MKPFITAILFGVSVLATAGPGPSGIPTTPDPADIALGEITQSTNDANAQKPIIADPKADPLQKSEAQQRYDQDVRKIENAAGNNNQNAPVNLAGGQALVSLNEPRRSLPLLDRAIDVSAAKGDDKTLGQALFTRAAANVQLRDFPAISRDARRILSFDPNNQQARLLLSLYEGRVASSGGPGQAPPPLPAGGGPDGGGRRGGGLPPAAEQLAHDALLSRAEVTASQIEAARYVRQAADKTGLGDKSAAKQLLDKALLVDPRNVPALLARSKNATASGDAQGGLADADAAVQANATKAEAYFLRGEAKKALKYAVSDYAADYAKASELDPSFSAAEMAALAGAPPTPDAGASDLAHAGAAARAKGASSYKMGPVAELIEWITPQHRKPVVLGAALLFLTLVSWVAFKLLRRDA